MSKRQHITVTTKDYLSLLSIPEELIRFILSVYFIIGSGKHNSIIKNERNIIHDDFEPFVISMIVSKYFLGIVTTMIEKSFKLPFTISNRVLRHAIHLKTLKLCYSHRYIIDKTIRCLTNLITLDLNGVPCKFIDNITIQLLANKLTTLRIDSNVCFRGNYITLLTNLTELDIGHNEYISSNALNILTNLRTLNLLGNHIIKGKNIFSKLTNLTDLNIRHGYKHIRGKDIEYLTNLTKLDIGFSGTTFKDKHLKGFTKLTKLNLRGSWRITPGCIKYLPNLTTLNIRNNDNFTIDNTNQYENIRFIRKGANNYDNSDEDNSDDSVEL
jgi:hypothetical protein